MAQTYEINMIRYSAPGVRIMGHQEFPQKVKTIKSFRPPRIPFIPVIPLRKAAREATPLVLPQTIESRLNNRPLENAACRAALIKS